MTDPAISPLRRRLIKDMMIRRLSPRIQYQYIRHVKKACRFSGPVCRQGYHRGCPSLSVVAGIDRHRGTDQQRRCHCPAVLLQGRAEAPRSCPGGRLDPRAPPPARCRRGEQPADLFRAQNSVTIDIGELERYDLRGSQAGGISQAQERSGNESRSCPT